MGLDNGIVLKAKEDISVPDLLKLEQTHFPYDLITTISAGRSEEICYWRKCYGIRNEIINIFGEETDSGGCALTSETVSEILDILNKYLDKDYYNEHHRSAWDFAEMGSLLIDYIEVLAWAKQLLEEDKIELEFYDSY